jgi:DNA recombination protein RmuC
MQNVLPVVCFIAGFLLAWVVLRARRQDTATVFQALSAESLARNNRAFLELARANLAEAQTAARGELEKAQTAARGDLEKRQQAFAELVAPVRESLEKVDARMQALETARASAYAGLQEQVRGLAEGEQQLRSETGKLVTALRSPAARGNWGEMQLRRVVEMAGMLDRCDFQTQASVTGEDGRQRPDLLIHLPAGKTVVVDAKTPLDGYLRAIEAVDEPARKLCLADHARQVRQHLTALSRKSYWEQFEQAPEFAVLFLPGECFFSAALEADPSLIEFGAGQNIILATPTTLIALLRAVYYGWRQEKLAEGAAEIAKLGKELFERLSTMGTHIAAVGKGLERAVDDYNKMVGSLETRVMVSARKFAELKTVAAGAELAELKPVDKRVRRIEEADRATGA